MTAKRETSKKRPTKPFTGTEGKRFSKENQPAPAAKSKGWQEVRKERHLTQEVIKELIGADGMPNKNFKLFIKAMFRKAKQGNPKAIDVISKCLEDDVIKIQHSGIKVGKDLADETYE